MPDGLLSLSIDEIKGLVTARDILAKYPTHWFATKAHEELLAVLKHTYLEMP